PGVAFDWRKIVDTPIPSADAERWRERRRVERAEKAARRKEAAARVTAEAATPSVEAVAANEPTLADDPIAPGQEAIDLVETLETLASRDAGAPSTEATHAAESPTISDGAGRFDDAHAAPSGVVEERTLRPSGDSGRRRRRRRRRGRRGGEPRKPDGGQ